jgi:hypothetical protein
MEQIFFAFMICRCNLHFLPAATLGISWNEKSEITGIEIISKETPHLEMKGYFLNS